jgi:hypothetical protein
LDRKFKFPAAFFLLRYPEILLSASALKYNNYGGKCSCLKLIMAGLTPEKSKEK